VTGDGQRADGRILIENDGFEVGAGRVQGAGAPSGASTHYRHVAFNNFHIHHGKR